MDALARQKAECVPPCVNHRPQSALPHIQTKAIGRDIITLIAFALDFVAEVS